MKKLISLLMLCMVMLTVSAVPARKKPFTHTQSNGQQISLMLVGDENLHYYLNLLLKYINNYKAARGGGIIKNFEELIENEIKSPLVILIGENELKR